MVFVADALAAWLVGLLADAGRKKLTTLVLGSDQERALRRAATVAIESTAAELASSGGDEADQLAMLVSEVFRDPTPGAPLAGQARTVLEAMQAGIAERLSVLDDAALTGTGQSSAEVLGVPGGVLAETLARHLLRQIMVRGSGGGALASLADQLNHDVTHLQGQRLEGMLAQLADQVRELAAGDSGTVVSHPVRLLPRPTFLAGRDEMLADLDDRLTGTGADGPQVMALCGLGGVGKTSVALEYAYRHLAGLGVAWQFAAEDPTVLAAGFGDLAAQHGARRQSDPVASVHAVLAAYQADWLLIFDNTPDRTSIEAFLPPAGRGRVLITSRNQMWPPGQVLDVPVLDIEVAAAFLVNRTGDPDRQAAAELAGELGGLPLALEQAAAYIQATGDSLAGYLASFRQRRTDLLARGEPTAYSGTVTTTWRLAFEHVQQATPGALGLLRLLACCAPDAIPLRLLLQPRPGLAGLLDPEVALALVPLLEDQLAAKDAIAALRRHSLISPPAEGAVSVHRLVQAVTVAQMPAGLATAWRQAVAAVIEAALPDDSLLPENWPVFAVLLPHAQAALTDESGGMWRIAQYLGWSGSYAAARDLFQRVLDANMRVLGPEHPETLAVCCDLAHYIGEAGDAVGARDQFAVLLPVFERVLGPEHPATLSTRGYLARWTGLAGDAAGARDQYADLLPMDERVSGGGHPETLAVRANLAYNTGLAGDAAGARDQYAALLPVHQRLSGAEHRETLAVRANLARWTGLAGDAAGAHHEFVVLLPVFERVLGAEHPETLKTRRNLAYWTGKAGDAAGARDQYADVLPMEERASGAEHPEALKTRGNLARWTGEAGDAAGARDQFAVLLPVFERVLGAEHPDTLTIRGYLARWTGEAGDAAGARNQFAALLPVRERVSGAEHPETLAARINLAYWTSKASSDPDSGVK